MTEFKEEQAIATEKPFRILVVDDDPEVLRGTCRVMAKAGYTTLAASTGAEALQSVRSHHPQLVLLDRQLPDQDGLEVCRRIKEDPTLGDVLVVIVSGVFTHTAEQITGLESGIDGYIVRPVGHRELVARVQAFVRIARLTGAVREQAENVRVRNVEIERLNDELRRELTERRRAEEALQQAHDELEQRVAERTEALRASEARYRRITEGLTDYQYTVRFDHGCAVATTHSPACGAVTGYTAAEFAADPYLWIRMVAREDRERVRDCVQRILAGKEVPPMEHRIVRKDGETRWVRDTTILCKDASGNLQSV